MTGQIRTARKHDFHLDTIVNQLSKIGEDKKKAKWIMKDGLWLYPDSHNLHKFPDMIIVKYDDSAVPVELKGNPNSKRHAQKQLMEGFNFIERVLDLETRYGLFVLYKGGNDSYDIYPMKRNGDFI